MRRATLDDFTEISGWSAVASGQAQLDIAADRSARGAAMRLDFDFKGGGGFVVARKRFSLSLPDAYVFTFDVRAAAPANKLEFKLVDPGGHNVWRHQAHGSCFPADWRSVRIRSSEIEFAWGPAGSGPAHEIGALEFAIVAPPGGKGMLWIANLAVEDHSYESIPVVQVSTALPHHEAHCAVDGRANTSWQSERSDEPQWLLLDFGQPREYGGLVLHWDPMTPARSFDLDVSDDGSSWKTVHSAEQTNAPRSYVYLADGRSRQLRLRLHRGRGDGNGVGIAEIDIRSREFSRSLNAFFHGIAANEPRGSFPRYWCREQTWWTPVSSAGGGISQGLLGEDGMLEVDKGAFSIEPFLYMDNELVTWADVSPTQELEQGFIPIPSSVWRKDDVTLRVTAFASDNGDGNVVFVRYRFQNRRAERRKIRLFVAVRPFQVTPPWQAHGDLGGVSPIGMLEYVDGIVSVNGRRAIVPLTAPDAFGAVTFDGGSVVDYLRSGDVPPKLAASDRLGCASGALRYDLELGHDSTRDIYLATSSVAAEAAFSRPAHAADAEAKLVREVRDWQIKLDGVDIRLPPSAKVFVDTFRTAVGHILSNRDGPALQPGPRRYARSWIRDGATMASALLRVGRTDEVLDYVRWYALRQASDGTIPCCVDRNGSDWLPEYDSQGEFIYAVMDCFRFSADHAFLAEMWPAVAKSVDRIEALRSRRLTSEFYRGEKRACYGLLPESVSHEGYLAHPVHAYWDDFWALRGLNDAATMARTFADSREHARLVALRDSFRETLCASIASTIAAHKLDYIPASVELADIDPAATANAVALLDLAQAMPAAVLARTFEEYLTNFRKRRSGELDWINYSPYEMRIIGALVRLGRRESAFELAQFFLGDRRPSGWNQWPEIAWRDPRSPAHIGDMPHTWIAAEFALAFRSMLAFERDVDDALVVVAGVPAEWLASDDGIAVDRLPTSYGTLRFAMQPSPRGDAIDMDIALTGNVVMPSGGIIVQPPVEWPLRAVVVNGQSTARFTEAQAVIEQVPARVRLIS